MSSDVPALLQEDPARVLLREGEARPSDIQPFDIEGGRGDINIDLVLSVILQSGTCVWKISKLFVSVDTRHTIVRLLFLALCTAPYVVFLTVDRISWYEENLEVLARVGVSPEASNLHCVLIVMLGATAMLIAVAYRYHFAQGAPSYFSDLAEYHR